MDSSALILDWHRPDYSFILLDSAASVLKQQELSMTVKDCPKGYKK